MASTSLRVLVSLFLLWGTVCAWGGKAKADFWKRATRVAHGIVMKKEECKEPRLQKWFFVRVDAGDPRIGFHVTGPSEHLGEPMPDYPKLKQVTRRQRTVDFLNECRKPERKGGLGLDMVLAVNASPWHPWCAPWNHKYASSLGYLVSRGKLVDDTPRGPSLVVFKDGKLKICRADKQPDLDKVWCAVSGFQIVLEKGELCQGVDNSSLAPRVGYGLSRDRRYLYILLVDGRQPKYSQGATIREVADRLREMGSWSGMNMDGGGSSTLVIEKHGKGVVLNKHTESGYTRTVGSNLGVFLKRD